MRIVYMGNNWVGWRCLRFLKERGEEVVGLVVHPPTRQQYREEILRTAGLPGDRVFDASRIREPGVLAAIRDLQPELGVSVGLAYILRGPLIRAFPRGCVNAHPSLLPHNRGVYPNVWSIVEQTPSGVTLHYMDESVDTGDLIAQREVPVEPIDTGETLYRKLERALVALFEEKWPEIRAGTCPRTPQDRSQGVTHRYADVEGIDEIDLSRTYRAKELIDLLRARTFPPYRGAYFLHEGRRVHLRLHLEYEDRPPARPDKEVTRDARV